MAAVKVTPMMLESAAVDPKAPSPPPKLGSMKKYAPDPAAAANSPPFRACLPGSSRGAEFKIP